MNQSQSLQCQYHQSKEVEYLCLQPNCPEIYSSYCNYCKDEKKLHNHDTYIYLADYLIQLGKIIQNIGNLDNNAQKPSQMQNYSSKIYNLITNLERNFIEMFKQIKDQLIAFQNDQNIEEKIKKAHQQYENNGKSHLTLYTLSKEIDNYLVQNRDKTNQISISIQPEKENLDSLQRYSLSRLQNQLNFLLKTFETPLLKFSEYKIFKIVKPYPMKDSVFNFQEAIAHEFTFEATTPLVMTGFYIPLARKIQKQVLQVQIHSKNILKLNVDLQKAKDQAPTLSRKMLVHFGDQGLQMFEKEVISIILKINEDTEFDNYSRANMQKQFKIKHERESVNKSATRDMIFITDILYYEIYQ